MSLRCFKFTGEREQLALHKTQSFDPTLNNRPGTSNSTTSQFQPGVRGDLQLRKLSSLTLPSGSNERGGARRKSDKSVSPTSEKVSFYKQTTRAVLHEAFNILHKTYHKKRVINFLIAFL